MTTEHDYDAPHLIDARARSNILSYAEALIRLRPELDSDERLIAALFGAGLATGAQLSILEKAMADALLALVNETSAAVANGAACLEATAWRRLTLA